MVKLYTAALLGVALFASQTDALSVSQAEKAKAHQHLHLKHKHAKHPTHKKEKSLLQQASKVRTPEDDQQAVYEQQVLEAAQKDPELMAALQSAA